MNEKFYGPWVHCVSSIVTEVDNKVNSTQKQLQVVTSAMEGSEKYALTQTGVVYIELKNGISTET